MTSYSKYFNIAMKNATCADIVHSGNTCWEMFHWNATCILIGCCRYIGPISMIPILMKIRQVNTDLVKQCGKNFLEYSLAAWLMSVCGLSCMCLYYKLIGRFHVLTCLALPAMTGASLCTLICSNRLINMFSRGLSAMVTEAIIKLYADNNIFLRNLRDSKLALTLVFMYFNTLIIFGLQQVKSDVFWFIQPLKRIQNFIPSEKIPSPLIDRMVSTDKHYCQHKNSCDSFIKQEVLNYFKFGIGIEIIRMLLSNWKGIINIPLHAFHCAIKIKFNFIAFLVGYVGIYRISTCLLTRFLKNDTIKNHLMSAFLSGASFYLYPQISLFCHAFVTAVELSWKTYNHLTNDDVKKPMISFLNKMPLSRIMYPIAFGYLCYLRPFYPWATPKIMMTILRGVTLNKETDIMNAYCTRLLGYSQNEVLYLFGRQ